MLGSMRKGARDSVLLKMIFGAIVVVFVFWGVGSMGFSQMEVVARVNDEIITTTAYERAYRNLAQAYRDAPPELFPETLLRQQTLDQMINTELLLQEAARLGLQVDESELRESIVAIPAFQGDGRFNKEIYLQVLTANGLKASDFEDAQRRQLLATKLQEVVVAGVHVSEQEIRDRYSWENGRVRLRYVRVISASFADEIVLNNEDVRAYYSENQESLRKPERVSVRYLEFRPDFFRGQLEPSDEAVLEYYDSNQQEYRRSAEVRARQILIKKPADADEARLADLATRAGEISKAAKAGQDFEVLVAEQTGDVDIAASDLGLFGRGVMQTPIEEAAFTLEVGGVSDVIETDSGFHILEVEEKTDERVEPLEDVREAVLEAIRSQEARSFTLQRAEAAHEILLGGTPLDEVASEMELTVQAPSPFGRTELAGALGRVPAFNESVFATPAGEIGEIVTLDSGYVMFEVVERIDSHIPELEAVRDHVESLLRGERATAAAMKEGETFLAQLAEQPKPDLDGLADAEGLTVQETAPIGRGGGFIPDLGPVPELAAAAFELTPEAPLAPSVYRVGGDALLAVLLEQIPADESAFETARQSLGSRLEQQLQSAAMGEFLDELKGKAQIEIGQGFSTNGGVS